MIRHWRRERPPGWRRRLAINAFGCTLTAIVAVVVTIAKAPQSLIVIVLIPVLVGMMNFIHRQYAARRPSSPSATTSSFRRPASRAAGRHPGQRHQPGGHPGRDLRADARDGRPGRVHHRGSGRSATSCGDAGSARCPGVPLVIVESPFRALVGPLTAYLDVLDLAWPPDKPAPITIVVLPEFVARHWWDRLLYNQSAKRLKSALVGREHTVIADVPYRRGH